MLHCTAFRCKALSQSEDTTITFVCSGRNTAILIGSKPCVRPHRHCQMDDTKYAGLDRSGGVSRSKKLVVPAPVSSAGAS